jgi:hypothetical protein
VDACTRAPMVTLSLALAQPIPAESFADAACPKKEIITIYIREMTINYRFGESDSLHLSIRVDDVKYG